MEIKKVNEEQSLVNSPSAEHSWGKDLSFFFLLIAIERGAMQTNAKVQSTAMNEIKMQEKVLDAQKAGWEADLQVLHVKEDEVYENTDMFGITTKVPKNNQAEFQQCAQDQANMNETNNKVQTIQSIEVSPVIADKTAINNVINASLEGEKAVTNMLN